VAADGMTKITPRSGAIHLHPLLRVERESRQLFARLWGMLSLQWNQQVDGRCKLSAMVAAAAGFEPDDDDE
jgi:hypothetical protein